MGHRIVWDNTEKTVVLQQYTPEATKDDLYQLVKASAQMLTAHEHTIHLIVDERCVNFTFNTADVKYIEKLLPSNQGAVMVVVRPENATYKAVFQDMTRHIAEKNHPHFVFSLDEARDYLQKHFAVVYADDMADRITE